MDDLRTLAFQIVAPYWVQMAWSLSVAGWVLVSILWGTQTYMAAQGARWPAMYVHGFKTLSAWAVTAFFLLSLIWREPAPATTLIAYSRNIVGGVVLLALFLEACWRIKETAKARAKQGL